MDQLRIDIIDGRLSTHGFELRTRPLDGGTEVHLVPLSQTVSDPAVLYARLLADAADPVAFLEAVEPADGPDPTLFRVSLDSSGRVPRSRQQDTALTVHTTWEDPPQTVVVDPRTPVATVLLERALRRRGARISRTDRNFLVGSAPDGRPLLAKDARTDLNGMPAVRAAERKDVARDLLSRAGIAIPDGASFDRNADPAEALDLLVRLSSVVIKPVDGDQGRGVTVGVTDPERLREAWDLAQRETRAGILVEEVSAGDEVRVLVVDGRAHAVARRIPPHVTGDGVRTIRDLVNAKNSQRRTSFYLHGKPIRLTPHRLRLLADSGLTPVSVLECGQRCDLDVTGNVRTGAEAVDATDVIEPSYLRIAERAVAAVPGLRTAGVDLIGTDLATPAVAGDHVVLELNPNPGIGIHAGAQGVRPRDVAGSIADAVLGSRIATPAVPPPGEHAAARNVEGPSDDATTSEALLAAAFRARGFALDWIASRGFFAHREDRVHGVWGAMTDLSAHSAVFALQNPNAWHELLEHAEVPVLEGLSFTRWNRDEAHAHAAQWGLVAVHGGAHRPILVDAATVDAFTAAWDEASDHATPLGMRVTRAPSGLGRRVLVAQGTVIAVVEEDGAYAHRDEWGLPTAVAAAAALPGLDLAEVVVGPGSGGTVVTHIRADPDLNAFRHGPSGASEDVADRIVSLRLGTDS